MQKITTFLWFDDQRSGPGCLESLTRFHKWNRGCVCHAAAGSGSGLV
jgi:hypothetical protein